MTDPTIRAIEQLEKRRYDAMLQADLAVLGDMLSDNLAYTHSNAARDAKESYLEKVGAKFFDYHAISNEDQEIKVFGDVALVTGVMKAEVTVNGTAKSLNNRYLAVWLREAGEWRFVAYAPTPVS
ncbi:nuclear transport factor 2 family protein [Bosea sp. 2RAB26]|uniref:nuclear transport factor 2 family protein n=1 Tax=Bosea sp. 2RAB26 TaxID=3237476 RepID=UPI003F8DC944